MGDRNAAQAAELVSALRDQLREMTTQLARVEHRLLRLTAWNHPAHELRLEAAALRRDIAEAKMHMDRLQRRYPSSDERNPGRCLRWTESRDPGRWLIRRRAEIRCPAMHFAHREGVGPDPSVAPPSATLRARRVRSLR